MLEGLSIGGELPTTFILPRLAGMPYLPQPPPPTHPLRAGAACVDGCQRRPARGHNENFHTPMRY